MKAETINLWVRGEKRTVNVIDGEFGKWSDAGKFAPKSNGSYLVILESTSPVELRQSWAGEGKVEIAGYNNNYDTSKNGINWNSRGTLIVAFWMPKPKFDKTWMKHDGRKGEWVDK